MAARKIDFDAEFATMHPEGLKVAANGIGDKVKSILALGMYSVIIFWH
jgi:hypothetical protein